MLQPWNLEVSISVPLHIIFEHRASDIYKLEEAALPATSLLRTKRQFAPIPTRLWEKRTLNVYEPGENTLLAAPLMLNKTSLTSTEPLLESGTAEQEGKSATVEPEARLAPVALTQVKFRQVLIAVDDAEAFWDGVVGGQVAAVEEQQPLSGVQVFALFEDAVHDLEFSETWLLGYLLGLSDALLRQRKLYPRAYTTRLKPLK